MPTITDNRGNGALLNKLMSTKFPASAMLMELASYMRRMSLRTVVEWVPREGNKEADKLANGNAEDFSASTLSWDILPEALEAGEAAERQSQEARERGTVDVELTRRGSQDVCFRYGELDSCNHPVCERTLLTELCGSILVVSPLEGPSTLKPLLQVVPSAENETTR